MSNRRGLEAFYGDRGYARDLTLTTANFDTNGEAAFVSMLAELSPAPVIDLGAGFGRHMAVLRNANLDVFGVDIVFDCCRRSSEFGPVVCAATSELPFRAASFGVAYSYFTSVGFTEDAPGSFLAECARILVPQGFLVLEVARFPSAPRIEVWRERIDCTRTAIGMAIRMRSRWGVSVRTCLITRARLRVALHTLSYTAFASGTLEEAAHEAGFVRRRDLESLAPASSRELLVLQANHA